MNTLRSIIFLTDGDGEDVSQLVWSRNTADIDATIFSYTLGSEAINAIVPQRVAELTGGIYTHIDDGDDNLLTVMSSYYLYYAYGDAQDNNDMVVTSPYLDFSTGQPIITMSLPIYFQNYFIGVVGTNVPLAYLTETIGDQVLGRKSYSFVVNQQGEVLLHPLNPLSTLISADGEYQAIYIDEMEPNEFDASALISRESGTQKIEGTVKETVCVPAFYLLVLFTDDISTFLRRETCRIAVIFPVMSIYYISIPELDQSLYL